MFVKLIILTLSLLAISNVQGLSAFRGKCANKHMNMYYGVVVSQTVYRKHFSQNLTSLDLFLEKINEQANNVFYSQFRKSLHLSKIAIHFFEPQPPWSCSGHKCLKRIYYRNIGNGNIWSYFKQVEYKIFAWIYLADEHNPGAYVADIGDTFCDQAAGSGSVVSFIQNTTILARGFLYGIARIFGAEPKEDEQDGGIMGRGDGTIKGQMLFDTNTFKDKMCRGMDSLRWREEKKPDDLHPCNYQVSIVERSGSNNFLPHVPVNCNSSTWARLDMIVSTKVFDKFFFNNVKSLYIYAQDLVNKTSTYYREAFNISIFIGRIMVENLDPTINCTGYTCIFHINERVKKVLHKKHKTSFKMADMYLIDDYLPGEFIATWGSLCEMFYRIPGDNYFVMSYKNDSDSLAIAMARAIAQMGFKINRIRDPFNKYHMIDNMGLIGQGDGKLNGVVQFDDFHGRGFCQMYRDCRRRILLENKADTKMFLMGSEIDLTLLDTTNDSISIILIVLASSLFVFFIVRYRKTIF